MLFINGDLVPEQGKIARGCQPCYASTDDADVFAGRREQRAHNNRLRLRKIGRRAFGKTDRHWLPVAIAPMTAGVFTRARTYPTQNGREHVVAQIDFVGLTEAPLINRFEIARDVRAGRTGDLARNVLLEPEKVLRGAAVAAGNGQRGNRFEIF